jgi:hypothetical protein
VFRYSGNPSYLRRWQDLHQVVHAQSIPFIVQTEAEILPLARIYSFMGERLPLGTLGLLRDSFPWLGWELGHARES